MNAQARYDLSELLLDAAGITNVGSGVGQIISEAILSAETKDDVYNSIQEEIDLLKKAQEALK